MAIKIDYQPLDEKNVTTHITNNINYHFGYSYEDDEFVKSSDEMHVRPGEGPYETYKYEKEDKELNIKYLVERQYNLTKRLLTENKTQTIKSIQKALANINFTLAREPGLVAKIKQSMFGHTL